MIQFSKELRTAGDGYWSDHIATVQCTKLMLPYVNDQDSFGELRVYFNTRTWRVNDDGLIYTDSQFLNELRAELTAMGLRGDDVDYSEQGMQGDNYVSLDVGGAFINSWQEMVDKQAA